MHDMGNTPPTDTERQQRIVYSRLLSAVAVRSQSFLLMLALDPNV